VTSGEYDERARVATSQMALDFWKLLRTSERLMAGLPEDRRTRMAAQLRFSTSRFEAHLDSLGLTMPTFEGQVFGPELPAVAVNADEFGPADDPIVDSAVEPALIWNGRVIQPARVMLKENQGNVSGN